MNKIIRQLMSGASLAVLSLGVPTFAVRASAQLLPPFGGAQYVEESILVSAFVDGEAELNVLENYPPLPPEFSNLSSLTVSTLTSYANPAAAARFVEDMILVDANNFIDHQLGVATVGFPLPTVPGMLHVTDVSSGAFIVHAQAYYFTADNALNNTALKAYAHAFNASSATATADGGHQVASGLGAYNLVRNKSEGAIEGFAHASDAVDAYAHAAGVYQKANGINHATNEVINLGGLIGGSAVANGAEFDANASAAGIYQTGNAPVAHNTVENYRTTTQHGYVFGSILAYARAYNASDTAHAYARGVYQDPPSGSVADNLVFNSALIAAVATAHSADEAFASATGIYQHGAGVLTDNNVVQNFGTIEAFATAYDASTEAGARARGIDQHAAYGLVALNSVANAGFIGASALASDATGTAHAQATDVHQHIYDALDATNKVTNTGTMLAFAQASSADFAEATAEGIHQHIYNGPEGGSAHNVVTNGGLIGALAVASDAFHAEAHAVGVHQRAIASDVSNNVTNSGLIVAGAVAKGGVVIAPATLATASAFGIEQAAGGEDDVDNTVNNSGAILAAAEASDALLVHAVAAGVTQHAGLSTAALSANNHVTNTTDGFIVAVADAGLAGGAAASAAGVRQNGYAHFGSNHVENDGAIIGLAAASAVNQAVARAAGVYQYADDGTGQNFVTNDGLIIAAAFAADAGKATATAGGVYQVAYAYDATNAVNNKVVVTSESGMTTFVGGIAGIAVATNATDAKAKGYGVAQSATYAGATSVHDNVHNDGFIVGVAYASGVGLTLVGGSTIGYTGHATASAVAVYQNAVGIEDINNYVYNDGAIGALAYASDAAISWARAAGVYQKALDAVATDVHQTVDNYLFIAGLAYASDANTAHASAAGIYQTAEGESIHNNVNNNGYNTGDNIGEYGLIAASATAESAHLAEATAVGVFQKAIEPGVNGDVYNHVDNEGVIAVAAFAHDAATAKAAAAGIEQVAGAEDMHNSVLNYGTIAALASVSSATKATAKATGVHQIANGYSAHNDVHNSYTSSAPVGEGFFSETGLIEAFAYAYGTVDTTKADAEAIGVHQEASISHDANNYVYNSGVIHAYAEASSADTALAKAIGVDQHAVGSGTGISANNAVNNYWIIQATAFAHGASTAKATAIGVNQVADVYDAQNHVYNTWEIMAKATATYASTAKAEAIGVAQNAGGARDGFANNYVFNDDLIQAQALAFDATTAKAVAIGVDQYVEAPNADNHVTNEWTIQAKATARSASSTAHASATGVHQVAVNDALSNYLNNGGEGGKGDGIAVEDGVTLFDGISAISSLIEATAYAYDADSVTATALGVNQEALGNHVFNAGTIKAVAEAWSAFDANASAAGVYQHQSGGASSVTDYVTNNGIISAYARASSAAFAEAQAGGVVQYAEADALYPEIENNGTIKATAIATGGSAIARAVGIGVANMGTVESAGLVGGMILNGPDGVIKAEASASDTIADANAWAIGIGVRAGEFTGTIENDGQIDAQAFGNVAQATGIAVEINDNPNTVEEPGTGLIVNHGGFIFASANYEIGNAINVQETAIGEFAGAPNAVDIVLEGGDTGQMGELFGNIRDAAADWSNTITVRNGITYLDGSINPGLVTLANGGTLTILGGAEGGTLWLPNASTSFWGANPVLNVNAYNQAGTLKLDLDGFGNAASINAVTASLTGGVLLVNPNPYTLFDTMTVAVVNVPSGGLGGTQWSSVQTTSVTPLLSFSATYSSTAASIVTTRTAFDAVPGLTHNEENVGDGLEGGYGAVFASQSLSDPSAAQRFYESMFLYNSTQYPQALNMLSDTQAGEVAQANVVSANTFVDKISARLSAMSAAVGGGAQLTSSMGKGITLWAAPYVSWTNTTSSESGPGYVSNPSGIVLGGDMALDGNSLLLGAAVSIELKNTLHFKNGSWNSLTDGGFGTTKGWNLGLYARYNAPEENGSFYLQGSASYGNYDNTVARPVTMLTLLRHDMPDPYTPSPPKDKLPPFDNTPEWSSGVLSDAFTSDVWSLYAEGGIPVITDSMYTLTPFVGVRYINSHNGGYDETGASTAPALKVSEVSAVSVSTYLGAQLTSQLPISDTQVLLPSLRAAWAHDFNDNPWQVDAMFSGITSSGFSVDGSAWSHDSAVIDAQLSMIIQGNMMVTVGYEAHANSYQTNQSLYGRFDIKF